MPIFSRKRPATRHGKAHNINQVAMDSMGNHVSRFRKPLSFEIRRKLPALGPAGQLIAGLYAGYSLREIQTNFGWTDTAKERYLNQAREFAAEMYKAGVRVSIPGRQKVVTHHFKHTRRPRVMGESKPYLEVINGGRK